MQVNSAQPGTGTSRSEVTSVGPLGFWLLVDDREYFVPFDDYPAFRQARVSQIFHLNRLGPDQFQWPDLDVDIELDALRHPDHYPLTWK